MKIKLKTPYFRLNLPQKIAFIEDRYNNNRQNDIYVLYWKSIDYFKGG